VAEEKIVLVRLLNLEEDSGYFRAASIALAPGERCVVEHGGLRLGVVTRFLEAGEAISEQLERVVRPATPADLDAFPRNLTDAEEVLSATREAVSRNGLPMHLVAAEYTLDRSDLRIYFTAPHRVDFRSLLRELAARYGVRIELRQMGTKRGSRAGSAAAGGSSAATPSWVNPSRSPWSSPTIRSCSSRRNGSPGFAAD